MVISIDTQKSMWEITESISDNNSQQSDDRKKLPPLGCGDDFMGV